MDIKWQALILTVLILLSLTLTRLGDNIEKSEQALIAAATTPAPQFFTFQRATLVEYQPVQKVPMRKWDVQDPNITAHAALVHSLEDNIPLFRSNTHESWSLASLTKLLTAVVVLEDIGINKKIPISKEVIATEGEAGNLTSGEVYTARDLLKIMLLTSSNDAAAAFEEYLGGKETFVRILTDKTFKLGMTETVLEDGSGLSDMNKSTASDLLVLVKYILSRYPELFTWTRITELLVQPINDVTVRNIYNINTLVDRRDF
ncbi:unnamed protein product, partial [marine sediment metagenome]